MIYIMKINCIHIFNIRVQLYDTYQYILQMYLIFVNNMFSLILNKYLNKNVYFCFLFCHFYARFTRCVVLVISACHTHWYL